MVIAIAEGGKKERRVPEEQPLRIPQLPPIPSIPKEMRTPSLDGPIKRESGKPRVLIVDDEVDWRRIMSIPFESNYEIFTAENGAVALNLLKRMKEENNLPVAVITDLMMPAMDGDELIRKARMLASKVKFVLTTVNRGDYIEELVDDLKPDMFVRKPIDPVRLRLDFEELLKESEPEEE